MKKSREKKIILPVVVLLVVIVPITYTTNTVEFALFPKSLVMSLIITILSITWAKEIFQKRLFHFKHSPLTLPIMFYLFVNLISLRQSINMSASIYSLSVLTTLIILYLIVINNISITSIYTLVKFISITGFIIAIIGIIQYIGFGLYWIPSVMLPSATFANRNIAAMVMIMIIPMGVQQWLISNKFSQKIFYGLLTSIMIVFLIYTRTRGAWLGISTATLISILLYFFYLRKKINSEKFCNQNNINKHNKLTALIFTSFVIIMSLIPPSELVEKQLGPKKASGIYETSISIFEDIGENGRITLWKKVIKITTNGLNWLTGVGLNNYQYHYPLYSKGFLCSTKIIADRPLNDYLWILVELGIVGLITYFWLLITNYYLVYQIIRNLRNYKLIILTISLMSSLTAILVHAFFSFPKERITPSMLLWLILGFNSIIYQEVISNKFQFYNIKTLFSNNVIKFVNKSLLLAITIVCFWSLEINYKWFMFDKNLFTAQKNIILDNNTQAIEAIKSAEYYGHLNYKAPFLLGISYIKQKRYHDAITAFNHSLKENPNYLNAHYNLGVTLYKTEDYIESAKHFITCVEINPNFYSARFNLGLSLQKIGMIDEAETQYKEALRINPKAVRVYNNLGIIFEKKQNFTKAMEMYNMALKINPDDKSVNINLKRLSKMLK